MLNKTLKESLKELKEMIKGNIPKKTFDELWEELNDSNKKR